MNLFFLIDFLEEAVVYRVQQQGGFVQFLNNLVAIAINKRQNEFW
jgi:hypothetical protein